MPEGRGRLRKSRCFGPKDSTPSDAQHHHPHITLIRLLLGELTSLSFVKLVFCTQEGRQNEHKGVLFFDVSHTLHTHVDTHVVAARAPYALKLSVLRLSL